MTDEPDTQPVTLSELMRQTAEYEAGDPSPEQIAEGKRQLLAWMAERTAANPPADEAPEQAPPAPRLTLVSGTATTTERHRQLPTSHTRSRDTAPIPPNRTESVAYARPVGAYTSYSLATQAVTDAAALKQPLTAPSLLRGTELTRGEPAVLRLALGAQLKLLREAAGLTRDQAAAALRTTHARIRHLELGSIRLKQRDLDDLLTLYGVTDSTERAEYLTLTQQASSPRVSQQYSDVMAEWFASLVDLEVQACVIRTYEVQFIPGLLQTPDYARAVMNLGHPHTPHHEIDRRVALRMHRQHLLTKDNPPHLWVVLDEAALRRPLGSPQVMSAQIRRLLKDAQRPNVTLQVAPFSVGGLSAAGGPITILRFQPRDLPDIVYLEQLTSAVYLDAAEDLDNYAAVMDRLSAKALAPAASATMLETLLKEY